MNLYFGRYIYMALLMPVANLMVSSFKGGVAFPLESGILELFLLILSATGEEIIFRGFLQSLFFKMNLKPLKAIVLVNVLFGVAHFVNVYSYGSYDYVILQAFCAFCIGIFLSFLYFCRKSLVLCVISHSLINLTSERIEEIPVCLSINEIIVYSFISVLYLAFSYKFYKNIMGDEDN